MRPQNAQWRVQASIEAAEEGGVLVLALEPVSAQESPQLPQRDIVMLLDCSGSMSEVWDKVVHEACAILDALPVGARFSALAFSETVHVLIEQVVLGTQADRAALRQQLLQFQPPYLGTNMGLALRTAIDLLCDPAPQSPSLLRPLSGAQAAPPMIFLATDGRSVDAVDVPDLQRQPHVTVHVCAYTTDPDAQVLAQLCSATGGRYLFCPTADAAAQDPQLALQRAQQVLSAAATPALCAVLRCTDAEGQECRPRLLNMERPLRLLPGTPLRLPFESSACTFNLSVQCLDGSKAQASAAWTLSAGFFPQAQRDVDAARLAQALEECQRSGDLQSLQDIQARCRARVQRAAAAQDAEKQALAQEALEAVDQCLAQTDAATLPHLAMHLASLSQSGGGAYGGGTSETQQLASALSQALSGEAPSTASTCVFVDGSTETLDCHESSSAHKRARRC